MVNKGPVIFGVGAILAALGFLLGRKPPAEAAPPEEIPEEAPEEAPEKAPPEEAPPEVPNTVSVYIKNPPAGADFWSLSLTDRDITTSLRFVGYNGKDRLDLDEVAVFKIPSGLNFPLLITALSISQWKVVGESVRHLYEIQSFRPYKYDFDKMAYGDEPDPNYRNITIPDYGTYYLEPK